MKKKKEKRFSHGNGRILNSSATEIESVCVPVQKCEMTAGYSIAVYSDGVSRKL